MVALAAQLVCAGADGIVTGVLTPEGQLDPARHGADLPGCPQGCRRPPLWRWLCTAPLTSAGTPAPAWSRPCALGLATILSSGQAADAYTGRAMLAQMQTQAAGRIEILAGSGVSAANIPELVRQTGVTACHPVGQKAVPSRMAFRREGVPMGLPGFDEFTLWQTDAGAIRAARTALDSV